MDILSTQDVKRNGLKTLFDNNKEPDILVNNAGLGYFADVDELA